MRRKRNHGGIFVVVAIVALLVCAVVAGKLPESVPHNVRMVVIFLGTPILTFGGVFGIVSFRKKH